MAVKIHIVVFCVMAVSITTYCIHLQGRKSSPSVIQERGYKVFVLNILRASNPANFALAFIIAITKQITSFD
jgi:hypothetical protein